MGLDKIFALIKQERQSQDKKWGDDSSQCVWTTDYSMLPVWEEQAKYRNKNNERFSRENWLDVMLEEVYEAFNAPSIEDKKAELVQVAAVAVKLIQYLEEDKIRF